MIRRLLMPIFFFLILLGNLTATAQVIKAEIGIDGLTCSMCSRSTEMSIRKLSFVEDMKMDLESTTGEIFFKKNTEISFEKIVQAVKDAGFSVRFLSLLVTTDLKTLNKDDCFSVDSIAFKYVGKTDTIVSGITKFQLIGKGMMSPKQYKKWSSEIKIPCDSVRKTYFVSV